LLVIITLAGSYNISGIVNPRNVFFSLPDQEAIAWIKGNTPAGSVFFVNSYPWDGVHKPTDGGYWVPYFTGRTVVFPNSQEDYDKLDGLFSQANVDYVYLGSGFGELTPMEMAGIPASLVYAQGGIFVYKLQE
jgi:hypothetical protein